MSYEVMLQVSFQCPRNDEVAKLAAQYLPRFPDGEEAHWFLRELSTRRGENNGPRGGMSVWSTVGNYTIADEFVESLRDFWEDLLRSDFETGPSCFDHIIVLSEHQDADHAVAFEIYLSMQGDGPMAIVKHKCPFTWGI